MTHSRSRAARITLQCTAAFAAAILAAGCTSSSRSTAGTTNRPAPVASGSAPAYGSSSAGSGTAIGGGTVGGGTVGGGTVGGGTVNGKGVNGATAVPPVAAPSPASSAAQGSGTAAADSIGGVAVPAPSPYDVPSLRPDMDPRVDPLSTFALDVDTASYGYAQRTLTDGGLPDPSTVRPEEFVNSFAQDYAQPDGNGFSIAVDGARMTVGGDSSHHVVRVGLQTRADVATERPDAQLTFVIDVSGSMGDPGKLDLVQQALHTLVAALRPSDAVGIVTFSERAHVVRPLGTLGNKGAVDEEIDALRVDASTNLQAGLEAGYRVARAGYQSGKTNRVILLSDGLANTGETDVNRLVDQVRESAGKGITLLGVGVGSDYGDALMEKLADKGNGFTSYVSNVDAARKLFVDRLPSTLAVRARDAKAQIAFDARTVASYRLIGYEDRAINNGDFRNDRVDGGQVGPGHSVTALYDVRLRPGVDGHVGDAQVHWVDPSNGAPHDASIGIDTANIDRGLAQVSPRLVVDVAAASLALTLGNASPYRGNGGLTTWPTLDALSGQLDAAARSLDDRDVFGLVDLVRMARSRLG